MLYGVVAVFVVLAVLCLDGGADGGGSKRSVNGDDDDDGDAGQVALSVWTGKKEHGGSLSITA